MDKIYLLILIIIFYAVRFATKRLKSESFRFLFVSFYVFCIPFDFIKGIDSDGISKVAGTLGATYYINLSFLMILILLPFSKPIKFRFGSFDWIKVISIFIIISLINPYNIYTKGTIIFAMYFFSHILMFSVMANTVTKNDLIHGIYDAFLITSAVQCALAICFPLLGMSSVTRLFHESGELTATRHGTLRVGAVGTFGHPGNLALFTVITSSFFLASYLLNFRKKISLIFLLMNTFTLILTYSRTSYVSFIIVMIGLTYIYINRKKNIFSLVRLFQLFLPVSLALIWLIYFSPLSESFLESDSNTQFNNREIHILMSYVIFNTSPFLGVGLNAHLAYLAKNFQIASTFTLDEFFLENPIHNIHLIVLAETGIVGLVLWLIFLVRNVLNAKKMLAATGGAIGILSLFFIGIIFAFFIYGLAGWSPFSRAILPLFLFVTFFSLKYKKEIVKGVKK